MKTKKSRYREILNLPVSPALFKRFSGDPVSATAFFALAAFALWPAILSVKTMTHCDFGQMIRDSWALLDGALFPGVTLLSLTAYGIILVTPRKGLRPLSERILSHAPLLIFSALLLWMCVMLFVHGLTDPARYGSGLTHESFFLHLEYYLCFFPLGLLLRDSRLKRLFLRLALAVSAFMVPCAFYLWKYVTANPEEYIWQPSLEAVFSNSNYYGYFLTVFVSLSAALMAGAESRRWRGLYAAALVLNTIALSYNRTRGAWLGCICACLFLVAARRVTDGKFRFWPLASVGLFALVFVGAGLLNGNLAPSFANIIRDADALLNQPYAHAADRAGSGRGIIWKRTLDLIRRHPFVGYGYDGLHAKNLGEYVGNYRPHNEYLQYALFYGIPGAVLYALACLSVYVRAWRRRARLDPLTLAALTAAFAYLAGSFFGLTVYNTAPYLFIMLGLGYVWGETESA